MYRILRVYGSKYFECGASLYVGQLHGTCLVGQLDKLARMV